MKSKLFLLLTFFLLVSLSAKETRFSYVIKIYKKKYIKPVKPVKVKKELSSLESKLKELQEELKALEEQKSEENKEVENTTANEENEGAENDKSSIIEEKQKEASSLKKQIQKNQLKLQRYDFCIKLIKAYEIIHTNTLILEANTDAEGKLNDSAEVSKAKSLNKEQSLKIRELFKKHPNVAKDTELMQVIRKSFDKVEN